MYQPNLNARSRVMMFAPHPDDESLAAGVFLLIRRLKVR